jgi:multisubunit Na+/H+ antiporter MnhB subunit
MIITIFSIVSSAVSIASFIYIYFSKYEKKRIKLFNRIVLPIVGVVAVLLSFSYYSFRVVFYDKMSNQKYHTLRLMVKKMIVRS